MKRTVCVVFPYGTAKPCLISNQTLVDFWTNVTGAIAVPEGWGVDLTKKTGEKLSPVENNEDYLGVKELGLQHPVGNSTIQPSDRFEAAQQELRSARNRFCAS